MTLQWNDEALLLKVERAVNRGIADSLSMVRQESFRLILTTPKSGAERPHRTQRGVTHVASAPGEPFASETGLAVSTARISFSDSLSGRLSFGGAGVGYPLALEVGTEKMEARPYLVPALINKYREVEHLVAVRLREGL